MKRIARTPGISSLLGKWYRANGNWERASVHLSAAATLRPDSAKRWEAAARALDFAQKDGAEAAYRQASDRGTMSSDSWYRYGRVLERKKDFSAAAHAYERAEAAGKPGGHMAFRLGRCLASDGRLGAASFQFRRAAELGFDPRECYLALESMLERSTPKWLRLDLLREGKALFRVEEAWTASLARIASEMNFSAEAVELFEQISVTRKLSSKETVNYVLALEAEGQVDRSRRVLRQASSLLADADVAAGNGAMFQRERMWTRAKQEFLALGDIRGYDAELAGRVALAHDREYRWMEAAEWFERAFRLDPSAARFAYKCGHALERSGKLAEAEQWYKRALRVEPRNLHYWYRLGNVLAASGDLSNAVRALRESLPQEDVQTSVNSEETLFPSAKEIKDDTISVPQDDIDRVRGAAAEGIWAVHSAGGLVRLANEALMLGLTAEAGHFATSAMLHRVELPSNTRSILSRVLEELGRIKDCTEVLLDSRLVRTPDGVDLKTYLPNDSNRPAKLYSEFVGTRPIDPNVVVFESNHGAGATCHPLALFKQMALDERFESARFVWALKRGVSAPEAVRNHPRVAFLRVGSDSYLYHLATAGFLINNVSFPSYFSRREGQRYLNTWHGTPMKTLGLSMKQGLIEYENLGRNFLQASHLIAPNELTKWALLSEHHLDGIYPGSFKVLGSPRLDSLITNGDNLRAKIRSQLKVAQEEHLVLIAPTWRGGVSARDLDTEALLAQLKAVSAIPGMRVFYRAHRLTEELVAGLELPVEIVPNSIDTNELLSAVDHLVSDYSSIIFDFLVTGRPITLYVPDIEEYREQRGLYVEPDSLPVRVTHSVNDLVDSLRQGGIECVDGETYKAAVDRYASHEDGRASARCLEFFLSDTERGALLNDKPTLVFHASLIPNGIASALLAILSELVRLNVNVVLVVEPSVLRAQDDRAGVFQRVPSGVKLIARTGSLTMTPEELYIRASVESGRFEPGSDMLRRYKASWALEARRIAGDLPVATAIEWDGYATLWAGMIANLGQERTRRLIWQHNDMAEEESHKYPELDALFRMYSWYDSAVSVSDLIAQVNHSFLETRGLLPTGGVRSVRNALPFAEISTKAAAGIPTEFRQHFSGLGPTVVTVGRMSKEKNHSSLVAAWPLVVEAFPAAKLVIVGSGPLEAQIQTQIRRSGLEESVVLTGQIDNPYPLISEADLFVLPSLHEGQPIVLFEAMHLRVKVAASACPGNVEALESGYGKIIPTDPKGIADAVIQCIRSESANERFDHGRHQRTSLRSFLEVALETQAAGPSITEWSSAESR